jgi:hypothetical protein
MRSTSGGAHPVWTSAADSRFKVSDPKDAMKAGGELGHGGPTLVAQDPEPTTAEPPASRPLAIVIIEAEAKTLWRDLNWVVAAWAAPTARVKRLSFLRGGPSRWLDIDLPTGETSAPDRSLRRVTVVTAKLFRNNVDFGGDQHYTRVRLDRAQREVTEHLEEQVPDRDRPWAEPLQSEPIDLPRRDAPPDAHAAAWRQVEEQMAGLVKDRSPWIGEVKTPFPKGLAVPCGDVLAVLEMFQRLGAGRIWIEGDPPPKPRKEGGGWEFGEGK